MPDKLLEAMFLLEGCLEAGRINEEVLISIHELIGSHLDDLEGEPTELSLDTRQIIWMAHGDPPDLSEFH